MLKNNTIEKIIAEKSNIIIITAVFILLILITWNKWGTLYDLDNQRELALPYFINKGLILYKDIYFFYGPLMPYFQALLFKLFGTKLQILYILGLTINFIYCFAIYLLARHVLTRFGATIASLLFLVQVCFSNTISLNLVFPYSFDALFGGFLSLTVALLLANNFYKNNNKILWCVAFLCLLCLFVKQEFALSCISSFIFYFLLLPLKEIKTIELKNYRMVTKYYFQKLIILPYIKYFVFIGIGFLALFLIFSYYTGFGNLYQAFFLVGRFKTSLAILMDQLYSSYYISPKNIFTSLFFALSSFGVCFFVISLIYYLIKFVKKHKSNIWQILVYILLILSFLLFVSSFIFIELLKSNPYIYSGLNIWVILLLLYSLKNFRNQNNLVVALICFASLVNTIRMFFNLQLALYSYYLLPISIILFVYILLEFLPQQIISNSFISKVNWIKATKVFFILLLLCYFSILFLKFYNKQYKICYEFGTSYFNSQEEKNRQLVLISLSKFLKNNSSNKDLILCFPEESVVYVLSDRLPASKYYYMIPETIPTKEGINILINDIRLNKPKFIVVSNNRYLEMGFGEFGTANYYPEIMQFIKAKYTIIKTFTTNTKPQYKVNVYSIKN